MPTAHTSTNHALTAPPTRFWGVGVVPSPTFPKPGLLLDSTNRTELYPRPVVCCSEFSGIEDSNGDIAGQILFRWVERFGWEHSLVLSSACNFGSRISSWNLVLPIGARSHLLMELSLFDTFGAVMVGFELTTNLWKSWGR
ncbi:uncharacterized protein CANTADRAFT_274282 [Suhomyces tanzawaensis NRRL Y-17324]|uniref:Uncharacterized protein n=1 Tax=Suhomyces tanzawaensis NRRL Y-17324 TaxID=984487 RepID=A0A1E4SGZ0_9ASCO|nr:uncharacterized protein CANTADRAFT_274282 [Suhomyces tanzawaensis NRRL Y-17324]ODV78745.1 hypothetical protein CANTADRAFT_274282 [Suhomyces tanzawaensis NRRL Y-17324]